MHVVHLILFQKTQKPKKLAEVVIYERRHSQKYLNFSNICSSLEKRYIFVIKPNILINSPKFFSACR